MNTFKYLAKRVGVYNSGLDLSLSAREQLEGIVRREIDRLTFIGKMQNVVKLGEKENSVGTPKANAFRVISPSSGTSGHERYGRTDERRVQRWVHRLRRIDPSGSRLRG